MRNVLSARAKVPKLMIANATELYLTNDANVSSAILRKSSPDHQCTVLIVQPLNKPNMTSDSKLKLMVTNATEPYLTDDANVSSAIPREFSTARQSTILTAQPLNRLNTISYSKL